MLLNEVFFVDWALFWGTLLVVPEYCIDKLGQNQVTPTCSHFIYCNNKIHYWTNPWPQILIHPITLHFSYFNFILYQTSLKRRSFDGQIKEYNRIGYVIEDLVEHPHQFRMVDKKSKEWDRWKKLTNSHSKVEWEKLNGDIIKKITSKNK